MSRSFIFSSETACETAGWKRIRREVLRVLLVLLALELMVRIGPIHALLAERLDPYENLLWYDEFMPRYQNQLRADPNYTVWLLGSSPMMTAWNPSSIQSRLQRAGYDTFTVQNYGFTTLTNLQVMSQVVDRWLLQLDQPQYAVLGISQINFSANAARRMRIEDSPLENIFIYPDTIDDYANRFLYETSVLYRYVILARNALTIPIEETDRSPRGDGGYLERVRQLTCVIDPNRGRRGGVVDDRLETNLAALDQMIDTLQARNLPVLVVSLPVSNCQLEENYGSIEAYQGRYLVPVSNHLKQRGITFIELDSQFYDRIPLEEVDTYFDDGTHMNNKGANTLSRWLSSSIADWLATNPAPSGM